MNRDHRIDFRQTVEGEIEFFLECNYSPTPSDIDRILGERRLNRHRYEVTSYNRGRPYDPTIPPNYYRPTYELKGIIYLHESKRRLHDRYPPDHPRYRSILTHNESGILNKQTDRILGEWADKKELEEDLLLLI